MHLVVGYSLAFDAGVPHRQDRLEDALAASSIAERECLRHARRVGLVWCHPTVDESLDLVENVSDVVDNRPEPVELVTPVAPPVAVPAREVLLPIELEVDDRPAEVGE